MKNDTIAIIIIVYGIIFSLAAFFSIIYNLETTYRIASIQGPIFICTGIIISRIGKK